MANINIISNNISGGSTIFGSYTDTTTIYNNFDWPALQSEAAALSCKVNSNESLKPAVTELEGAISSRDKENIGSVVKKYAAEFSTSTFANMASAGLLALIRVFAR